MYDWRRMTAEDRAHALDVRRARQLPCHSPPHLDLEGTHQYLISAACYEHAQIIGKNLERMHHGYVQTWQDWPWSSAKEFLERVGRARALEMWKQYPIMDYGKKWDVCEPSQTNRLNVQTKTI